MIFFSVYRYSGNLSVAGGISTADSITAGKLFISLISQKRICEEYITYMYTINIIASCVTKVYFMYYNYFKIM